MTEVWREIPGFPRYEASTLGRVRSKRWKRPLKGAENTAGYIRVQIGASSNKRFIHRLVALTFVPGIGEVVNHRDGDKQNNRPDNLEWCSRSENDQHALASGFRKPPRVNAKLTEDSVREVKASTESVAAIAARMVMSERAIRDIRNGVTWKRV